MPAKSGPALANVKPTTAFVQAQVVCLTVGPRVLKRMPTSLGGARGLLAGLKKPRGAWLLGCAAGGDALLDMVFPHCYRSPGMGQLINGHPYLSRFGGIPQSTFMFFSFFVIQTTRQASLTAGVGGPGCRS